jgi:molybdenum cofactor cytidylyltransferase
MLHRARTAAILTAAGASTRMGAFKALLPLPGGGTLLTHQLSQLHGFARRLVVTGAHPIAPEDAPGAELLENPGWPEGRQTSLALAARALVRSADDLDAVLIVAVDQPLTARVLAAVLEAADPRDTRPTQPVFPAIDGRAGHPVLVPASFLPELARLDSAPEGLRTFLAGTGTTRLPLPYPEVRLDLNRPEDWQTALDTGLFDDAPAAPHTGQEPLR